MQDTSHSISRNTVHSSHNTARSAARTAARTAGTDRTIRRTRRRVVAGAASATGAMSAALLAACGGGRSGTSGASETKWSPSRPPVTIAVLTRAGPFGHTGWYKDVTPRVFEQRFANIKVEWDEATGSGVTVAQKLLTHASAGTLPDVTWLNAVGDGGHGGIAKGVIRPLDPLIKAERFDRTPYWKAALDVMTYKGQLYALPTHGHFGANIMYVNLQLTKAAGVSVPLADANWTTDQVIDMARRVTRPEKEEWGFWPGTGIGQEGVMWLRTFGGDLLSADGKRCLLDTAEAQAALTWLWSVPNQFRVLDSLRAPDGSTRRFEQGQLAFMNQTPGLVAEWKKPGQERVKHELGITVVPKHPATGKRGTQVNAPSMGITTGSKHPEAAWEWVKFITNRDNGVDQVQGGAGSPGARHDVWNDDRLHKLDPIYRLIEKTYKEPGPVHLPHNDTWFEITDVVGKTLNDLWDGKIGVREAAQQATRQAQAILDRGSA